jgi:hypothetical protein
MDSHRAPGRAVPASSTRPGGSSPRETTGLFVIPGTTMVSASASTVFGCVGRAAYPAEVVTGPSSSVHIATS